MFIISNSALLQSVITVALFSSNVVASTQYGTVQRTKTGNKIFSSIFLFL